MQKKELIKNENDSVKKKNFKNILIVVSMSAILVILSFIFIENNTLSEKQTFIFQTVQGDKLKVIASPNSFKIPKLKNRVIFFKVFGWNCKYCQKEIPELIKLKKQFDGHFDVIAIESQHHTKEENIKHIEQKGINYYIVTGDNYQNFFEYLKKYYKWNQEIPLTIVVGEDGTVLAFEIGFKSYGLAKLLKVSLEQYKILKEIESNKKEIR